MLNGDALGTSMLNGPLVSPDLARHLKGLDGSAHVTRKRGESLQDYLSRKRLQDLLDHLQFHLQEEAKRLLTLQERHAIHPSYADFVRYLQAENSDALFTLLELRAALEL